MTSLAGKVVAVTGASGIAASAALRFADEGARLLAVDGGWSVNVVS